VHVRQRLYLVEQVVPPPRQGEATLVRLSCIDDDAQGQSLDVLWGNELDASAQLFGGTLGHLVDQVPVASQANHAAGEAVEIVDNKVTQPTVGAVNHAAGEVGKAARSSRLRSVGWMQAGKSILTRRIS
jgi:hypothetical protein